MENAGHLDDIALESACMCVTAEIGHEHQQPRLVMHVPVEHNALAALHLVFLMVCTVYNALQCSTGHHDCHLLFALTS
jgi:hypothetical protein